ncbi:hypothetical protein QCA50_007915 [Cerrena zonata]|uniref:Uncharacterized protein n=1 Tax=Cerrena zonata TaxID=2478898 RepID=A0AAW0GCZ9_9APHY
MALSRPLNEEDVGHGGSGIEVKKSRSFVLHGNSIASPSLAKPITSATLALPLSDDNTLATGKSRPQLDDVMTISRLTKHVVFTNLSNASLLVVDHPVKVLRSSVVLGTRGFRLVDEFVIWRSRISVDILLEWC